GKDGSAVVLNGKDGSIGLNGKDGKDGLSLKSADGAQGVDGKNGANGLPGKDGKTRLVYQPTNPDGSPNGDPEQVATLNDGLIFTGNNEDTLNRHKLNTVVKVQGEGVDKAASANFAGAAGNINVKANGSDTLEIQLSKDVKGLNSLEATTVRAKTVVTGDTTMNNDGITINNGSAGNSVSLTKNGLDNGNNRIVNVAPGIDGTDAVNVNQLKGMHQNINNRIDDVSDDANAGVSSAMAMAALPQAYIPGKSMLTGGIASYNGEGAVAVGFSKLSDNGRWVLKVSGSADTQGNAGGAIGAGFHF
uniref:YadA family autotransporter adhesin n=1 Tax=Moraxella canis TaxID=90239 RepID=UPI0006681706